MTTTTTSLATILVDGKTAAEMCGVSRTTWRSWDSAGLNPMPIRIGGRVLWATEHLRAWAAAGCPSRDEIEQIEGGDHGQ